MTGQDTKLGFTEYQEDAVAILRRVVTVEPSTIEAVSNAATPAKLYAEINVAIVRYGISGSRRIDLQDLKLVIKALFMDNQVRV